MGNMLFFRTLKTDFVKTRFTTEQEDEFYKLIIEDRSREEIHKIKYKIDTKLIIDRMLFCIHYKDGQKRYISYRSYMGFKRGLENWNF